MVTVDLKGLHRVRAKGRTYWYAWRGGPRITGEPGTPEFVASYNEAIAEHRAPDATRFRSVIVAYRASPDFQKLAVSTKRQWSRWLDRIDAHFGELRTAQFDRSEKIRPIIRKWRSTYADKPRTADYAMPVLSRVLSYAVDPLGRIASNPAEGIKQLYSSSRAEIIWTDEEISALKAVNPTEVGHAVDIAAHTGLRLGDLVRLSWSHIGEHEIVLPTGESKGKRAAVIPLYDDLRTILESIPRTATTVLASSKERPWTTNGFGSSFNKAKERAGLAERDLHFHDLRGAAATKFYKAGLSERVIAGIMGREERSAARIIRRHVGRAAATQAAIEQLAKGGTRT